MLSNIANTLYSLLFILLIVFFFFFKQKTAYEMRISDWSSDVCSSDLLLLIQQGLRGQGKGVCLMDREILLNGLLNDGDSCRVTPHLLVGIIEPSIPNSYLLPHPLVFLLAPAGESLRHLGQYHTLSSAGVCRDEIGRAHVLTPVTNAHLVFRLLLQKKKK